MRRRCGRADGASNLLVQSACLRGDAIIQNAIALRAGARRATRRPSERRRAVQRAPRLQNSNAKAPGSILAAYLTVVLAGSVPQEIRRPSNCATAGSAAQQDHRRQFGQTLSMQSNIVHGTSAHEGVATLRLAQHDAPLPHFGRRQRACCSCCGSLVLACAAMRVSLSVRPC